VFEVVKSISCLLVVANPLDIATGAEGKKVSMTGDNGGSFAEMMNLSGLFQFIKRDALIWSAIVLLACLVSLLFLRRPEAISEKKKDIAHKILIIFLISSLITILGIVVNVFDSLF